MPEHVVKKEGGKRYLIIDCSKWQYGTSVAEYPQCMGLVISKLMQNDADLVVLAESYEHVYDEQQTKMLKEVADALAKFEVEGIWSPSHLGAANDASELISQRHDAVLTIMDTALSDPFRAYVSCVEETKKEAAKQKRGAEGYADGSAIYAQTLERIRKAFEATELITRMKKYVLQLSALPQDRSIYYTFFEAQIKPGFVGSRMLVTSTENLELVDQYAVLGTQVSIFRHPDKVECLYHLNPPEYNLPPEKFFLLAKAKEIVAGHRPQSLSFSDISQARKYFKRIYATTIADLAQRSGIELSGEEREELAEIVARYTIGYGILEIILSDRKLTDVYLDAPLGEKPIYVVHGTYGQCQSNIIFTEEEAKAITSRFRALSGRPFDEAHPVLDFDLEYLKTRVCVIGRPLSAEGIAFALRLHKETPWTLAQFIDNKMITPLAAGLFSFLIDAQASTLVVGSRGSGKTSFMQALMLEIPQNLRIICQEDTEEIPIPYMKRIGFNAQRLKTRPPISVARTEAEVAPEEALRTALRLGDSVLIIGEVRSKEAKVLYEAMRIGAVGNVVMGTIHGENAYSVWDRVVNDLEVPTTSFKATDIIIASAPIRFKGGLKRVRRVIEVTEVLKHWEENPEREKGFLNIMGYSAAKDMLELSKENFKNSELVKRICNLRGLTYEDVWKDINHRAASKQYLVELKNRLDAPQLLEAENTVRLHNKLMLISEKHLEQYGSVQYDKAFAEWKKWADALAKGIAGGA